MALIAHSRTLPDLYVPAATIELGARRQRHAPGARPCLHAGRGRPAAERRRAVPLHHTEHVSTPSARDFLTPRGAPVLPLLALGTRVWIRMGYGDRARQKLLFSGFITVVGDRLRRRRVAGARGVGHRRHLPDDARHHASTASSRRRSATRSTRWRAENGFDLQVRRHAARQHHARLQPADRSRIPAQARPELLHPASRNGSSTRAPTSAGTSSISGRAARTTRRSRRCSGAPTC